MAAQDDADCRDEGGVQSEAFAASIAGSSTSVSATATADVPALRTLTAAREEFGVPGVISALRKVLRHEDVDNIIA